MKQTHEIDGWFNYSQTFDFLLKTIPENGRFVECGAWLGKSSSYLCDRAAATKPDVEIIIVDSWQGSKDEIDFTHKLAKEQDIYQLFLENMGNRKFTLIKELSVNAVTKFNNESLDVIFIDMCHAYDCIKEDLDIWYPKLKYNGYIAGHDISWPGVSRAVREKFPKAKISPGDCWIIQKTKEII